MPFHRFIWYIPILEYLVRSPWCIVTFYKELKYYYSRLNKVLSLRFIFEKQLIDLLGTVSSNLGILLEKEINCG